MNLNSVYRLGVLSPSIEAYSRAICIDPNFVEAYIGRGNTYMEFLSPGMDKLGK